MYKPPVEVHIKMEKFIESLNDILAGTIVSATEFADIVINKEELHKALLYDREQYKAGRRDVEQKMFRILTNIRADINIDIEDCDENDEHVKSLKLVLEYLDEIEDKFMDV